MAYIGQFRDGWRAQIQRDGVRVSKTFRLKRDAVLWVQQMEAKKTLHSQSLEKACDHYLKTVSVRKQNAVDYERRRFEAFKAHFGDIALSDIDSAKLGEWRDKRLETVSGSTVMREINLFRNLFRVAQREWKWITENPFDGVRLPKENPPRNQLWGWKLIKRVLRAERTGKTREMQDAFRIALRTGMRLAEVLQAPDNLHGRVVKVRTKTEKLAQIPIGRIAAKLLQRPSFTVGPNEGSTLFSKLCKELLIEGLTFHDSRATALTHLSKKVDVLTLAKISRHKNLSLLSNVYYRESAESIAAKI